VRAVCLVLMMALLYLVEDVSIPVVAVGWQLLCAGLLLGLLFWVLSKAKRIAGLLLPSVILLDALLLGTWVAFSGGAVSFYLPFFLLLLVSATLVLTPRKAAFVIASILATFLAALYLGLNGDLPDLGAARMNFVMTVLERTPDPIRRALVSQQALRWTFFMALTVVLCAFLMRQVWSREERLRAREKALEQKRHLIQMGELTGRLAHGVNTPLGLISGNLELLLADTPKKGKDRKRLLQIEQYAQRAIATVRDILAFGRQSMSEVRPVKLPEVVQAVAAAVQTKLARTGGQLVLDLEKDLPPVLAYPEGIFQALLNLVENALDSIRPGGLVTLSARFLYRSLRLSAEDRRGEVRLVVRDTGRGIPARELKRIFEPFYSTKGFGKGTGLGLSIVKRIVEEHRGSIAVESKEGEWTQFTLTLPTDGPAEEGYNVVAEGSN